VKNIFSKEYDETKRLIDKMKSQINNKVRFKFGVVKNERGSFSVCTDIYFGQEMIKTKVWTGKKRVHISLFDDNDRLTQVENVKKETFYFNSIYSCLSVDTKTLESIQSNFTFLSSIVMSQLALDSFKETKKYKMHCLYDKEFEKNFVRFD
jgi:hypothetical protein